jgi:hypothetical protein
LPPCLKNPSRDAKYLGIVNRKAKPNTWHLGSIMAPNQARSV